MKTINLTRLGACLVYIHGMCAGFLLSPALTAVSVFLPLVVATGGIVAIGFLVSILRVLGWRWIAVRTGDVNPSPPPRPHEVERALRTLLADGRSLPDAVQGLHQTFGWDVIELVPAVAAVTVMPQKEALRLVMPLTLPAESESEGARD